MKSKLITILSVSVLATALTTSAFALNDNCVNQVSMNFTAENWVNSETSLVNVALSASVPAAQVDQVTEAIKTKLAKASGKKDWRLINLARNESDSGLISITGQAVARLNNSELGALQTKLKSLNKPGEKYAIGNIDHQPDQKTINNAQAKLRTQLYGEVGQELKALNTALPSASSPYEIHKINFNSVNKVSQPVMMYTASSVRGRTAQDTNRNNAADNSSISGKMTMSAYVTYSALIPGCNMDSDAS